LKRESKLEEHKLSSPISKKKKQEEIEMKLIQRWLSKDNKVVVGMEVHQKEVVWIKVNLVEVIRAQLKQCWVEHHQVEEVKLKPTKNLL